MEATHLFIFSSLINLLDLPIDLLEFDMSVSILIRKPLLVTKDLRDDSIIIEYKEFLVDLILLNLKIF